MNAIFLFLASKVGRHAVRDNDSIVFSQAGLTAAAIGDLILSIRGWNSANSWSAQDANAKMP
jgi:hypothetical protein